MIAVAVDVGQEVDFDALRERALAAGAVEAVVVDARERARCATSPCRRCRPTRSTRAATRSSRRSSRPLIVRHLVAAARRHDAAAVAHGCTGKGNDQVRFEVGDAGARAGPRDRGAGAGRGA